MDAALGGTASDAGEPAPLESMRVQLEGVLADMESLGVVTELAGKVVGGVAMAASYYQHVLATEGHADELPACQLLLTRRRGAHDLALLPATQAQMEQGDERLPRESAVLSKILSPAAMTELHWSRVPAVVIFGCFVADEEELQEAAAAGIPISPSLAGPHPEEQLTQMEVFFKQFKYPEHKCFILRDWGFLIFASDLPDAMGAFNERLKETLVVSTEAADTLAADGSGGGEPAGGEHAPGCASGDGSDSGGTAKAPLHAVLASAFKRLQARVGLLRSQSEPMPADAFAAAAGPRSPKAGGGGPDPKGALLFCGASEPSSPMIGAEQLPESIRTISTAARRGSSTFRVPSFQTGFKPW